MGYGDFNTWMAYATSILIAIVIAGIYVKADDNYEVDYPFWAHGILFLLVWSAIYFYGIKDYMIPALVGIFAFVALCYIMKTGLFISRFNRRKRALNNIRLSLLNEGFSGIEKTRFRDCLTDEKFYKKQEVLAENLLINLVIKHESVLTRKRALNMYADEYGSLKEGRWKKDIEYFLSSVFSPARELHGITRAKNSKRWLEIVAKNVGDAENVEAFAIDEIETGQDYENYVAELFKDAGWLIEFTPATGDHGVDLIASRDGLKAAIQCKFYSGSVGNSSVQEVYSGKDFYKCHVGVVVSNSEFTKHARTAAAQLGIVLKHHDDLIAFMDLIHQKRHTMMTFTDLND